MSYYHNPDPGPSPLGLFAVVLTCILLWAYLIHAVVSASQHLPH